MSSVKSVEANSGARHILYFQQNAASGATEEYLEFLMEGLDARDWRKSLLCPITPLLDSYAKKLASAGVHVQRYDGLRSVLSLVRTLRTWMKQLQPDIVHVNDPAAAGLIAAATAGVPVRVMTHHTPELERKYNPIGKLVERIAFRVTTHAIFTSPFDRATGMEKEGWSADKTSVIPYGIDLSRFQTEEIRAWPRQSNQIVIGNVARLNRQKAQHDLLSAIRIVLDRYPSVELVFVGDGELRDELEHAANALGVRDHVTFAGHRADVPAILQSFDILAMPSYFEGLCLAVVEASAMGIPVVASRVGGMPYSVADKITGILVPPGDPQSLAEALIWLIEHPERAAELGRNGRTRARALFGKERLLIETSRLYERLLADAS